MLRGAGHPWAQEEHPHDAGGSQPRGEQPVQRSAVPEVLRSPGSPLDEDTRSEMEARLGADFSDVRVHSDSTARHSAAEIGAHAYTSGSHVVLGEGGGDKHTLAHELTHVIQQRQGAVEGTDNGSRLRISDPSDRFERAAVENAERVMSHPVPVPVRREAGPGRSADSGDPAAVQRMETGGPSTVSSAAEQEPDAGNAGRSQTEVIGNPQRVGLEIELTVDLHDEQKKAGEETAGLKNGDLLARSVAEERGWPVVKLEVEGSKRAKLPSIEVIYGPVPRSEYVGRIYSTARTKLVDAFRKPGKKQVALAGIIDDYNNSLKGEEKRYALHTSATGRRLKAKVTGGVVNQTPQTNVSVPYAKVGAAPPPAEPAGRGRGGSARRGTTSRGTTADPRGGATGTRLGFADLFHSKTQKATFEACRAAANGIDDAAVRDRPDVISLLTHVMFQAAMFEIHLLDENKIEDHKQHYDVILKVSPQDAVMGILDDAHAADLKAWLDRQGAEQTLKEGAGAAASKGGGRPRKVKDVGFAELRKAAAMRESHGRQQLRKRAPGTEDDHSSPVFDMQGDHADELRHFHPRASNRQPIDVDEHGVHHVVAEARRKDHLLNDPAKDTPEGRRERAKLIEALQER